MKFIEKFYAENKFRSSPLSKWCPYQLGYEPGPDPERKNAGKCPEAVKDYSCEACWNREIPEEKEITSLNSFPGFEINDVVQLRNGKLCIVLPNNKSKDNKSLFYKYNIEQTRYGSGLSCASYCCDYTDNINNKKTTPYDVIKLWRSDSKNALTIIGYFFNKESALETIKPIWTEQSAKKKKMTIKEIEQELGYPVEIVEESEKEKENEL